MSQWYRKVLKQRVVAEKCGVEKEFDIVGDMVHEDDMRYVQDFLGVTDSCMELLFAPAPAPAPAPMKRRKQ